MVLMQSRKLIRTTVRQRTATQLQQCRIQRGRPKMASWLSQMQAVKGKHSRMACEARGAGQLEFKKTIEAGLRDYTSTTSCRRDVANTYFHNPMQSSDGMCL